MVCEILYHSQIHMYIQYKNLVHFFTQFVT